MSGAKHVHVLLSIVYFLLSTTRVHNMQKAWRGTYVDVSIVEHGVPVMMICGAKNRTNSTFLRANFLILPWKCGGRTGWRLKSRLCTKWFSPRPRTMLEKHGRAVAFAC